MFPEAEPRWAFPCRLMDPEKCPGAEPGAALSRSGVLALSTSFPLSSFPLSPCPHDTGGALSSWGCPWCALVSTVEGPALQPGFSSDRGPFVTRAISLPRMAGAPPPGVHPCVPTQCPCGLDARVSSPRPTSVSSYPLQKRGASASLRGPPRRGQRSCPAWP